MKTREQIRMEFWAEMFANYAATFPGYSNEKSGGLTDLAPAEIARDKALITVRQLESENRELAARVDVGNALRNLLAIALKSGLTDQARAEARELLKEKP